MRGKIASIVTTAAMVLITGPLTHPTMAAPLVQECTPPGGTWGPGNTFRSKIEKYSDNTVVYMSQNFAAADKTRWFKTAPMSASGGPFTNGMGTQTTMTPEGDGYKIAMTGRANYTAHFGCAPATRGR